LKVMIIQAILGHKAPKVQSEHRALKVTKATTPLLEHKALKVVRVLKVLKARTQ